MLESTVALITGRAAHFAILGRSAERLPRCSQRRGLVPGRRRGGPARTVPQAPYGGPPRPVHRRSCPQPPPSIAVQPAIRPTRERLSLIHISEPTRLGM